MSSAKDKEAFDKFLGTVAKSVAAGMLGEIPEGDDPKQYQRKINAPSPEDVVVSEQEYRLIAKKRMDKHGNMYETVEVRVNGATPDPEDTIRYFVRVTNSFLDDAISKRKNGG